MDQQDDPAVPPASGQKNQPAPVWGGAADGAARDGAAPRWGVPANQAGGGHEPASASPPGVDHGPAAHNQATQDQPPQGQPAQGWGAPAPASPSPEWGTTPANGQVPNTGTGWGAPQQYSAGTSSRSGKGNWTAKKGVLVGGVVVVVAAAAGAGAYAAGNGTAVASTNNGVGTGATGQSGTGGQSGMTGQGGMMGPGGQSGVDGGMAGGTGMDGGPGGLGMGSAALNAAVHSEYVVLQDSSYVAMAGQKGTVTKVSATSLTVKSEDGFSRTYAVGSDVQVTQGMRQRGSGTASSPLSMSTVTTGATVRVTALKDSDTYTAQTIQLATAGSGTVPAPGTSSN
jgi:hypothetical protein